MPRLCRLVAAVVCLGMLVPLAPDPTAAESPTARWKAARQSARHVDDILAASWKENGIAPAELASDAQFLRRIYLDLVGVVPPVSALRQYVADRDPNKRYALVDRLLESPRHATHLANTWRRILLPDGFPAQRSDDAIGMQRWLRDRFAQNVRYDRIVGDFLTATGSAETGPALYYQTLEVKPEKLAASTARSFLGIQIQCAQCHDHPFDDWTQRDFWEYAAFFAQVSGKAGMNTNTFRLRDLSTGDVTLPEEDEAIGPAFPGDEDVEVDSNGARRLQLSIWLSSGNNPYLAVATANRIWWHLFGRGIVDPVDDIGDANRPSHPQALEELSQFFVQSDYNLRELIRAVAYTDAYQRSSRYANHDRPTEDTFAVMAIKNLTAEQIFDSLVQALQNNPGFGNGEQATNSLANPVRREFLVKMAAETDRMTHYSAGLQQTLHMMNDPGLAAITGDTDNGLLVAVNAPFLTEHQRLQTIFLSTLSRFPSESEQKTFGRHIEEAADDDSSAEAMADIVWALVNSAEFRLNH
jgi:hypothetical protein